MATDRGCTTFLSLGGSLPNDGVIAVLLGFKNSTDCGPSATETARELLDTAATQCWGPISDILHLSELIVSPPPLLKYLPACRDQEHDSEYLTEDVNNTADGSATVAPSYHPLTLQFTDPKLEAVFADEHNANLIKFDILSYLGTFAYMLCILFVPITRFNTPGFSDKVQIWRSMLRFLPALFLFTRRSRALYLPHREFLMAYNYFTCLLWFLYVKHYMDYMGPESFTKSSYMHGYLWLGMYMFLFQMRIRLLIPLVILCFAINATLLPHICATFYPAVRWCVGYQLMRTAVVAVVVPVMIVRCLEQRSRHSFISRILRE